MKLVTKEIEAKLLKSPLYSTEKQTISPVLVKFFTPDSSWSWYALEAELIPVNFAEGQMFPDWNFFGLVDGHEKELGYFTLSELQSARGHLGLPIERDMYFDGKSINKETNEVVNS